MDTIVSRFSLAVCLNLLAVAACNRAPTTPVLPSHPTLAPEWVLLSDHLGASDLRNIVQAINKKGQLSSLGPWVSGLTDAELEAVGDVLSRRVFRRSLDPDGIVALLNRRVESRDFSRLANALSAKGSERPGLTSLLSTVASSTYFLDGLERGVGFLSPELDSSLEALDHEMQRAWSCADPACVPAAPAPLDPDLAVTDLLRFFGARGLKSRWVSFCDSLTETWPVIGLLHGLQTVTKRRGNNAFGGVGGGLWSMTRTPSNPELGPVPTQYDSLMNLLLALEGPSDGLFSVVRDKLERNRGLIREIGSLFQPNVPGRLLPYEPLVARTVFGLLVSELSGRTNGTFSRDSWLALGTDPKDDSFQKSFREFFVSARTAHENLTGVPRESWAVDSLTFNLPIYLNGYTLARWIAHVARENQAVWKELAAEGFSQKILDTPVTVSEFELVYSDFDEDGNAVFDETLLKELEDFGLEDFVTTLRAQSPTGLGEFYYAIDPMEGISLREALKEAVLAIDEARGYADGSSLVRTVLEKAIERRNGAKSALENLETDDLLLATHRLLASMPSDSPDAVQSVVFEGLGVEQISPEVRDFLLHFYEDHDPLQKRFSQLLDAFSSLGALGSNGAAKLSPLRAYGELLREVGPREWTTLGKAWLLLASSGLFSMELDDDGEPTPKFPFVHSMLSESESTGWLRLISAVEPSKHRALADFLHALLRPSETHQAGETLWGILQEVVLENPEAIKNALNAWNRGDFSLGRASLSRDERQWIVDFIHSGDFRTVWELISTRVAGDSGSNLLTELRRLERDGTLKSSFQLVSLVRDDRMRAIGQLLQKMEASGELAALLDMLEHWQSRPATGKALTQNLEFGQRGH